LRDNAAELREWTIRMRESPLQWWNSFLLMSLDGLANPSPPEIEGGLELRLKADAEVSLDSLRYDGVRR
jgi:hypothetical protein